MEAKIIPFIPKPNPNRPSMLEEAESRAAEFLKRAPHLASEMVPYRGAGIDGMQISPRVDLSSASKSVASLYDLGVYVVPEKDGA